MNTTPTIIKVKRPCPSCNKNDNVRKDFDNPKTMRCCDNCGADFLTNGEITLNPKTI